MDKIRELLEAVKKDPKAQELVKGLGTPKNDTEAISGYLSVAESLNFSITEEEIVEGLRAVIQEQKASSESAAAKVSLADSDLESVAGGAEEGCADTYKTGEWCWFTDSCSLIINCYDGDSLPSGQEQGNDEFCTSALAFNDPWLTDKM